MERKRINEEVLERKKNFEKRKNFFERKGGKNILCQNFCINGETIKKGKMSK